MRPNKKTSIAIVGMSCKLPGAQNYWEFWDNLINKEFSVTEIPEERWDWRDYYDPLLHQANKTNSKWGGFIDDIDKFDSLFFGMSPKEANYLDPQHRLFLETVWHTMEDAGYSSAKLNGKKIGVYAGVSKNDYAEMLQSKQIKNSSFISTGTVHSLIANRVSYFLNLKGKSEVIDTACSSSLVALHNAIRDIQSNDCESAFVGGVNVMVTPTMYLSHGQSGMLSSEGKCKAFDESADGYVRGEGVACIMIKPLQKAIDDNDRIHAVINSSAVNHNGQSNTLTSPNESAQVELIHTALDRAGLQPEEISYIETHGPGTRLGDPIEINALKRVFRKVDNHDFSCGLGSVKTNLGHLECVSGMAGLIKVILSLKNKKLPSILHFKKLNPYINLEASPFYILDNLKDWTNSKALPEKAPLIAGVSSFGMGGVNAHVIVQEFNNNPEQNQENIAELNSLTDKKYVIPFSAKTKKQLKAYIEVFRDYILSKSEGIRLEDIVYTMQNGRDQMTCRIAFTANSLDEIIQECTNFLNGNLFNKELDPEIINWIKGDAIDWDKFNKHQRGKLTTLPGYSFDRRSCWAGEEGFSNKGKHKKNKSLFSLSESKIDTGRLYQGEFNKFNDYFIRDHVVQNEPMLPGVAYLELARYSFMKESKLGEIRSITDMFWLSPLKFDSPSINYSIDIQENTEGDSFKIFTDKHVHAKGKFLKKSPKIKESTLDINNIVSRCNKIKSKEEIYSQFEKNGLTYKSTFKTITKGFFGLDDAICKLQREVGVSDISDNIWEPSVMDAVFQSVVGLCIWGDVNFNGQLLPYFLKSVNIQGIIPKTCYAYVKKSEYYVDAKQASFDMYLCDEGGNIIVQFKEFLKRKYEKQKPSYNVLTDYKGIDVSGIFANEIDIKGVDSLQYSTKWESSPSGSYAEQPKTILFFDKNRVLFDRLIKKTNFSKTLLVLEDDENITTDESIIRVETPFNKQSFVSLFEKLKEERKVPDTLVFNAQDYDSDYEDNYNESVITMLYVVQAIMSVRFRHPIKILYVYNHEDSIASATHRMVGGFARTLSYEYPSISIFNLGIVKNEITEVSDIIYQELSRYTNAPLKEVLYDAKSRYERKVVPFQLPINKKTILKKDACYLITGGAGGIGMVFAKFLAEKYNSTLILVGRKEQNDQIEEKLIILNNCGGKAYYYAANVSNRKEVQSFLEDLKTKNLFLDGIIHAAGLIEDSFIFNKDVLSLKRVLQPKVHGVASLDECTKNEKLDFFVTFSSIASLMPNQGQSDYSSANSFMDHYMEIRNNLVEQGKRTGISIAINWPLWKNGGITVNEKEEKYLWDVFGMMPMSHQAALKSFEKTMLDFKTPSFSQIVHIEGVKDKIERHLKPETNHISEDTNFKFLTLKEILVESIKSVQPNIYTIEENDKLIDLGLNSIELINLAETLNKKYGIPINPTVFFEYNSVSKLEQYLQEESVDISDIQNSKSGYYSESSLIDIRTSDIPNLTFYKRFYNNEFYMRDHVVNGKFNVPGACFIEMGIQAVLQIKGSVLKLTGNYWPDQLSSSAEPIDAKIQLIEEDGCYLYEISGIDKNGKQKNINALGKVFVEPDEYTIPENKKINIMAIKNRLSTMRSSNEVYEQLAGEGLVLGPSFKPMKKIFVGEKEAMAYFGLPSNLYESWNEYTLHPSLLTGVFQTAIINNKPNGMDGTHFLPIGIDELIVKNKIPKDFVVHSVARSSNHRTTGIKKFDISVCDTEGNINLELNGFAIRKASENTNISL